MENAYNHVENALHAVQTELTAARDRLAECEKDRDAWKNEYKECVTKLAAADRLQKLTFDNQVRWAEAKEKASTERDAALAELAKVKAERDAAIKEIAVWAGKAGTLEADNARMYTAIKAACEVHKEVNKLPIGNFYLAETLEGFLNIPPWANDPSQPWREVVEALVKAADSLRDVVLNGRGPLEATLDNGQTNTVLAAIDDELMPHRDSAEALLKGTK